MDSTGGLVRAAAEVLDAPTAAAAASRLADALRRATRTDVVSRVHLTASGVSFFIDGDRPPPPPGELPTRRDLFLHPLTRFHSSVGGGAPATMTDALRSGIGLHPATLGVIERLRLSVHQLSVPLHAASPAEPYTGWVLVADEPIARDAVETMTMFQPLLRALDRHIGALATVAETAEQPPLTPREQVVLGLLAEGLTAQAIASRLAVSRRTVHKHLEHLYRKLGASDRLTAVMRAQGRGWLPRPHAPGQPSNSAAQSPR